MPRNASRTAGNSDAGSTAVRITNATGTPEVVVLRPRQVQRRLRLLRQADVEHIVNDADDG